MELTTAAALYFHMGFSFKGILCSLALNHRNVISMKTLKRVDKPFVCLIFF